MPAADPQPPAQDPMEETPAGWRQRLRGYLAPGVVLLASLVVVALVWHDALQRERKLAEADFQAQAEQLTGLIRRRVMLYELTLNGGVSLFASIDLPNRQQFRNYVDRIDIASRYPAMIGLGYAEWTLPSQVLPLEQRIRAGGQYTFQVHPPGLRPAYAPIVYLEPLAGANLQALGYDMYSEPRRRAAMDAARDSGMARMSAMVQLVQDGARPRRSVLMYSPIYAGSDTPSTLEGRRGELRGFVYAPFRITDFIDFSLVHSHRSATLIIRDVTDGADELLYADSQPAEHPAFSTAVVELLAGRRWRLEYRSGPASVALPRKSTINWLGAGGVLLSLLLFGLVASMARTEERARRIATRLTEDFRRSELRFRNAMMYSAIGKAMLDGNGRIIEANPALATIVGRSQKELVGRAFETLFDDDPTDTHAPGTAETVADGVYRTTRLLRRPDGDMRHAYLTYAPIPAKLGEAQVTSLVQVEDATERVRAEERVRALNRTLEARVAMRTRELTIANRELEAFAYSVSHDLRTPLRAIEGFSRLLTERYDGKFDDAGRDYLRRIRNAAGRMGDLIDAMLKMSRLSRSQLNIEPLDLSRMAGEVVAELRGQEPGRDVRVDIAPGMRANGDPVLVLNLLQNLIGNAWKFTGECTEARIEVGEEPCAGGGRAFFVRDNGAGFAQEYADKLFRPFQRLHSHERYAGHGIGLASVRRIVERHGGVVSAEGRPENGATFRFSLPDEPG